MASTRALISAGGGGQFVSSRMVGSPEWGMTETEKQQRIELVNEAITCLRAQGKDVR